jgi:hypothetical protein
MNSIFNISRYNLLVGNFDWIGADIRLVAFSGTPVFIETDSTVSQFKARGAVESGWSLAITSKTAAADGTAQTNQVVIPAVPVGPDITHFLMVKRDPAVQDNSELILFIDDAFELPFTPNGADLIAQPDWLAQRGWFRA